MTEGQNPPGWSADQPPPSDDGFAGSPPPAAVPPPAPPGPASPPPPGWGPPPVPPPAAPGWGPPAPGQPTAWGATPPADQPGVVPLRPLGLGQLYEGAFATVRRCWRAMVPMAAACAALVFAVSMLGWLAARAAAQQMVDLADTWSRLAPGETVPQDQVSTFLHAMATFLASALVMSAAISVIHLVLSGAVAGVVGRAVLGRQTTPGRAWRELRPLLGPLVGMTLLIGLGYLGGLMLCIVPGIIFFVFWLVAAPALVLERIGPIAAMRRSWHLVSGSWWRVFGIYLLTTLLVGVVASVISTPLTVITASSSLDQIGTDTTATSLQFLPTTGPAIFAMALAQAVTTLIAIPLLASVMSLLYIDLRIRKENLAPTLSAAARAVDQ